MKKFNKLPGKKKINYPFSKGDGGHNPDSQSKNEPEEKKTKIGLQSDLPFLDEEDKSDEDVISCSECQYPLRIIPTASSPCPNCGFSGNRGGSQNTISDSGKTINVGSLDLTSKESVTRLNFKLIDESINSEIKIESQDTELILNRDHLDPKNASISGEQHVVLKIKEGDIYLTDVSSNGSTFIQAKNRTAITFGTRLVIGNKIFLFNMPNSSNFPKDDKVTKKFGQFDMENESKMSFELIEESSGQAYKFQGEKIIINRSNIDPNNMSISSREHAIFENESGKWYIHDVSTNGSTFRQLVEEVRLENQTKLIIGNKVFRFEYN